MYDSREIFTRCSPSRVYAVVRGLSYERKELVRQMGFGIVLGMKKCNLRRDLILWLIEKFDPIEGSLLIGSEKFTLTSQIFGKILGIEDGGEDFGDLIMEDSCKRISGDRVSLTMLEEKLMNNDNDRMFVNTFLQFLCVTLLLPSTSLYVVRSLEEALKDINEAKICRNKNWSSISWRYLVEGVRRFKERRSNFIPGCVYFFQLFYLNELEGHNRYVDKSVCPSNWWNEKEIRSIFEWIHHCGGFEKVSVKKCSNDEVVRVNPLLDNVSLPARVIDDVLYEVRILRSEIDRLGVQLTETIRQESGKCGHHSLANVTEIFGAFNGTPTANGVNGEECSVRKSNKLVLLNRGGSTSLRVMYERFVDSGGKVVGPFNLSTRVELSIFLIAMHVFLSDLSLSDVIYRHREYEVVRLYFGTLLPHAKVDLQIVSAYVLMIRYEEMMKYALSRTCCVVTLPIRKRNGCLLDIGNIRQGDGNIPLSKCAKVLVPILDFDDDHWILVEFNKIDNYCGIWDSVGLGRHSMTRVKVVQELASVIDKEICWSEDRKLESTSWYSSMPCKNFDHVQLQDNTTDCGVFLMKFIESSVNMDKVMRTFDPHAERLYIGVKIIASVTNELWTEAIRRAEGFCLSLYGPSDRARSEMPAFPRI